MAILYGLRIALILFDISSSGLVILGVLSFFLVHAYALIIITNGMLLIVFLLGLNSFDVTVDGVLQYDSANLMHLQSYL